MPHPIQLVLALSAVAGLHRLAATRTGHLGDVLPHRPCYDAAACTVHKVRVHGCQRISNTGRCHVHRGTELHISIDFTVAFNATAHVDHQVLGWLTRSPHQRYPFGPWDACQSSGGGLCPLVDGVRRTFRSALLVHQSYPTSKIELSWTLIRPDTQDHCCFRASARVLEAMAAMMDQPHRRQ